MVYVSFRVGCVCVCVRGGGVKAWRKGELPLGPTLTGLAVSGYRVVGKFHLI